MSQLVKTFKPDSSAIWMFTGTACFGLFIAVVGFFYHQAMLSCLGMTLLTIFAALCFKQTAQQIEVFTDRIVFRYGGQEAWTLPYTSFSALELVTTSKNATKYSPGRTILLRFIDSDNKLCAEANVNIFDKSVIRSMIELIALHKDDVALNSHALTLLQNTGMKGSTIESITRAE